MSGVGEEGRYAGVGTVMTVSVCVCVCVARLTFCAMLSSNMWKTEVYSLALFSVCILVCTCSRDVYSRARERERERERERGG